jgi:PPOX class probable F420-dependent enzyme
MALKADARVAMTPEELDRFLAGAHVARVATADAEGWIHLTPVWFLWEDGRLRFTLGAQRPHVANLRRDPRVTVCVDEDERARRGYEVGARGVMLQGFAELSEPVRLGPAAPDLTRVFLATAVKHLGDAFAELDAHAHAVRGRVVGVSLAPERVRSWDFAKL